MYFACELKSRHILLEDASGGVFARNGKHLRSRGSVAVRCDEILIGIGLIQEVSKLVVYPSLSRAKRSPDPPFISQAVGESE